MPKTPWIKPSLFVSVTLLVIIFLGAVKLQETFGGDQAMFVVYAKEINNGAVLYRDIWDIKQPGIFIFYLVGGKLFGFTELGIHIFELLYWLTFSFVLILSLRKYFAGSSYAIFFVPLITVGNYYVLSGSWHLTQVEGLVGFPLFVTLLCAVESTKKSPGHRYPLLFLSGLAGSIALSFKLLLLPLVCLFWLLVFVDLFVRVDRNDRLRILVSTVAPILIGAIIPIVALLLYFAYHDALQPLTYTFFEYPPKAVATLGGEDRIPVLKQGLRWFIISFFPLITLIIVWCVLTAGRLFKARQHVNVKKLYYWLGRADLLSIGLFLWVLAGLGVILIQSLSWWDYHYLLLFIPLGILALKGLETVWNQANVFSPFFARLSGKLIMAGCVLLLFTPTLRLEARKIKNDFFDRNGLSWEQLSRPHGDLDEQYREIESDVAFLNDPNSRQGAVFVCAQPHYYYLSKRSPALATNGWMPEFFLPEQWSQMEIELLEKSPSYIVIQDYCSKLIQKNSPQIVEILESRYHLTRTNDTVVWYELNYR